jgi:hypothetical protein
MRLPSSSSLVFATLAISSSSSTLSALAAPTGDPAQAQSGVSAPNNHFMAARRGSISIPRSQDDDVQQDARSEEQVVEKRADSLGSLSGLLCSLPSAGPLLVNILGPSLNMKCPPSPTAQSASFDAMSVSNGTDSSNSSYDDPAWSAPPNTPATSSDVPAATETPASPPSRRDIPSPPALLPVQPTTVPDTIAGAAEGVAPTQANGAAPTGLKTVAGTFDGAIGTAGSEAVPGTAAGVVTGGVGTAGSTVTGNAPAPAKGATETGKGTADDKKQVPVKVVDGSPAPQPVQNAAGSAASTVPVRRSHRARRDVPASAPVQPPVSAAPSPPVHPPVSATPPVQPPVSASSSVPTTTVTSTITETAAPTSA